MANDITGVRKSAILLLTLEQDLAAEVLRRLPPEAVEEVSREIASLGEISLDTRKDVFGEFYNAALANSYISEGGLDYAKQLLLKTLEGHMDFVYDVAFSPDGRLLASVGRDALKVWSVEEVLKQKVR